MQHNTARNVLVGMLWAGLAWLNCGASDAATASGTRSHGLSCDDSIRAHFRPNTRTTVLLVRAFKPGDSLPVVSIPMGGIATPTTVTADLCLVKVLVGPGHPGPQTAPSTSAGIGIEVWLPSKAAWNGRLHALGTGGWGGGEETDVKKISSYALTFDMRRAATIAAEERSVASTSDTGHSSPAEGQRLPPTDASFAMNPDGTINTDLWNDFSSRAIHEQAVVSEALATAYYGSAPRFSYFDGGSGGGRQALKLAQRYPEDFDGIIAGYPAINLTSFVTAEVYPQLVIQHDLGGHHLSLEQLNAVSNAAIAACDVVDGKHLGFILDPPACSYDPTRDAKVLCKASGGNNDTGVCVTSLQAQVFNKIWYGMTADGSVPDPAVDNGFGSLKGSHRWYGLPRGTSLLWLASPVPFELAMQMVALELQDPKIAPASFRNAKSNGTDGWKSLSYKELSQAFDAGIALQAEFGYINTDEPDLSQFRARGAKLIHVHGTNDGLIPYQGSIAYYESVRAKLGGLSDVQAFYRLYAIPGMAHGPFNGTANDSANPPVPSPQRAEIFRQLADWVEKGIAPSVIILSSMTDAPVRKTLPLCPYPEKATYVQGDTYAAASYACR